MVKHALAESDRCRLLLENTAGAGNTIGRTFEELRELIDLAGGDKRIGVCLDSCHMFATGFDITTADKVAEVVDRFAKTVGMRRLKSLHVNDSHDRARLEPRPPHGPRRGQDRRTRLRGVPVGAALREAAGAVRRARARTATRRRRSTWTR